MQRQRLKFLTSVGVAAQPIRDEQQRQERERKCEHLQALLAQDRVDLAALRAAIIDGALHATPEHEEGQGKAQDESGEPVEEIETRRKAVMERDRSKRMKLRSLCWKLLLGTLTPHRKSWAFYARQQQEWYTDLSKVAAALNAAAPWGGGRSPHSCCSSLRFAFHRALRADHTAPQRFAVAERLVSTLALQHLVSSSSSDFAQCQAVLGAVGDTVSPEDPMGSGPRGVGGALCMPVAAAVLPNAEQDGAARYRGLGPVLNAQEQTAWRAEAFDLSVIALLLLEVVGGAGGGSGECLPNTRDEHEVFWCLGRFLQCFADDGAVFTLLQEVEEHISEHDGPLATHLLTHSLTVADATRVWIRSLFVSVLPLSSLLPLWDVMLCLGARFAVAVAVMLLDNLRSRVLDASDAGQIHTVLRTAEGVPGSYDLVDAALLVWDQYVSPRARGLGVGVEMKLGSSLSGNGTLLPPVMHYKGQLRCVCVCTRPCLRRCGCISVWVSLSVRAHVDVCTPVGVKHQNVLQAMDSIAAAHCLNPKP